METPTCTFQPTKRGSLTFMLSRSRSDFGHVRRQTARSLGRRWTPLTLPDPFRKQRHETSHYRVDDQAVGGLCDVPADIHVDGRGLRIKQTAQVQEPAQCHTLHPQLDRLPDCFMHLLLEPMEF